MYIYIFIVIVFKQTYPNYFEATSIHRARDFINESLFKFSAVTVSLSGRMWL